jgi:hypothetical protein
MKRYMFEFENCIYFTFFYEFLHKDVVERIAFEHNIHISYPITSTKPYNNDDNEMQDILHNNLKLFFNPSSPPSKDIIGVLENNGFKHLYSEYDRWIFHKITA